tara:strand:- start:320 stop:817 length:498 start_codon:yes stop_codon:yes gene_type:complete
MDKKKILDYQSIKKKIRRISLQILESNIDQDEIIIAGIDLNGFIIAKKISQEISKISEINIKLCKVKIDKKNPLNDISTSLNFEDYQNKSIVVIDDVLNSGATLMYSVKYFLNTKIKSLKTAVLVDRNHKKYPIKADFKGLSLSTSIQSKVEVVIDEKKIEAFLV